MLAARPWLCVVPLVACTLAAQDPARLRIATFNVALNRGKAGELVAELRSGKSAQAHAIAEIVQRVRPDVLLLNELDFDAAGQALASLRDDYLAKPHGDATPIAYAHAFTAPVNTGVPSGLDLNGDGQSDGADDAYGYGSFPGQYGMAVLSRLPLGTARTFQNLRWRDMPDALLPTEYYGEVARDQLRLSSKSHWDVPVQVDGRVVHLLACHPTPPVFDGPEDRNGRRNHDEIRLFADYLDPQRSAWIRDDAGQSGGLAADAVFVIAGDLNADPHDGDSRRDAIGQLLAHPRVQALPIPASDGAAQAAQQQAGANQQHRGDPRHDTGDFNDKNVGNLRLDYVLPSRGLSVAGSGVFWPRREDASFALVGTGEKVVSSDHRLVWVDVALPTSPASDLRGQPFGDLLGARFLEPFAFADHRLTLVRWWTDGCPFCADSLPALEDLRTRYATRGLAVVGMYHPKPPRDVSDEAVSGFAQRLGFKGELAIDRNWHKLADLQARGAPMQATSISVLVDRGGMIVWVHSGPRLHPAREATQRDADAAFTALDGLLAQRLR